jgi:UDP-3-O-acyl-N-acetylglucosamine deacetylase
METSKQKTLKGSFSLYGKGLHTGLNLTVTFNPAPENTGYKMIKVEADIIGVETGIINALIAKLGILFF